MSKKTKLLTLGTAMVALTSMPAINVFAATEALNVEADIVNSALAVTGTQNLHFGAFTNDGAGGTVDVNTLGAGNYVGVTQILAGPAPAEGRVVMTGAAGVPIDIRVLGGPTTPILVTHTTAAVTMEVSNFDINGLGRTALLTMAGTTMAVPIGAELTVPAGRPPGNYTGTFTVETLYD